MPLLEASSLETYYGPVVALRGVSIQVEQGAIVAVLGANGAGKSTLLKTISGAMDPQNGTVRLKGEEIQGQNTWDIARRGMIGPQLQMRRREITAAGATNENPRRRFLTGKIDQREDRR